MKRFAAIIFDMDGVIVDSEPLHERAFLEVFAEMGYADDHGIHFPDYYGRSDQAVWRDFIAKHHPPQSFEELLAWKQRRLVELIVAEKPIFEGLPELLEKLAPRYQLGLASGSPHNVIDEVLRLENLRRFFPVVVSVIDVGKSKPAPDVFLRTAELLGVARGEGLRRDRGASGLKPEPSARPANHAKGRETGLRPALAKGSALSRWGPESCFGISVAGDGRPVLCSGREQDGNHGRDSEAFAPGAPGDHAGHLPGRTGRRDTRRMRPARLGAVPDARRHGRGR